MASEPESEAEASSQPKKPKPVERLTELLEQRKAPMKTFLDATRKREFFYGMADTAFAKEVGDAPQQLLEIDAEIAKLVSRHHFWMTRLFSKTMKFGDSVVKVREQPLEVEAPKNESAAARRLFKLFGEQYVALTPKLKKRAIITAPQGDLELMKPLGIRVRHPLAIQVQSPSETGAKTIYKRPYDKP